MIEGDVITSRAFLHFVVDLFIFLSIQFVLNSVIYKYKAAENFVFSNITNRQGRRAYNINQPWNVSKVFCCPDKTLPIIFPRFCPWYFLKKIIDSYLLSTVEIHHGFGK